MNIVKAGVLSLQKEMLSVKQQDIPIFHHFANKTYAREMYLPAGCALVGKRHRYACINIIAEGKVRVVTEDGSFDYEAPVVFVSPANTKRAMYAITDTTWVTCHPTDTEDLEEIEKDLIIPELLEEL